MTFPVLPPPPGLPVSGARTMTVGMVQAACEESAEGKDVRDKNLARALPGVEEAARQGAQLVMLGELFLQGPGGGRWSSFYSTRLDGNDDHIAELERVAARLSLTLVVGCTTYSNHDVRNSALVIGPTGLLGVRHKAHLASFPYSRGLAVEHTFLSPGRDLSPVTTPLGRLGVHICYDIFYPEVSRVQALAGSDLQLNLAAAGEGFESYWDHLTWARAAENATWYLLCSVVGPTASRGYFGGSRIVSPDGDVVARARDGVEDVVVADVDLAAADRMRGQVHMFSARQPDLYQLVSSIPSTDPGDDAS